MVIFLIALAFSIVAFASTTLKARNDIKGAWSYDGPGRIADRLQSRNRTILMVVVAIVVGLALLEVFVPDFHFFMEDIQYAIGSQPMGLTTLASGGGISWGLYLLTLLGITLGILVGTKTACNAFGSARGISVGQLV